jgi:hypothetical protein
MFFPHGRGPSHWTQDDLILRALQFQGVSRGQLKLFPHRLGQNKPAGPINGQGGCHGIHFTIAIAIRNGAGNGCRTLPSKLKKGQAI